MVNAELGTTWCENKMNITAMKHALMIQKKDFFKFTSNVASSIWKN